RLPRGAGAARRDGLHAPRDRGASGDRGGDVEEPALPRPTSPQATPRGTQGAAMDEDELTDAERSALAGLSAESAVPAGLEDRVVESLRVRGLIAASPRRWSGGWPAAAAALALFLS